jgi:hypothetical protein
MLMILPLLLQAATAAPPPPATSAASTEASVGAANDAIDLFMKRCVMDLGRVTTARELDADPAHARAMTDREIASTALNAPDTVGWIVHGDRGGWMALTIRPSDRFCIVDVCEADQKTMAAALTAGIKRFYVDTLGIANLKAKPIRHEVIEGVACDTLGWEVILTPQHSVAIIATLGTAQIRGRQHMLSFRILK